MIGSTHQQITINDILSKLSEPQILAICLNVSYLPCVINSPFRIDKHPSFGLYLNDNKVYFKDLSTKESGNLVELLKRYWKTDYNGVLDRLYKLVNTKKSPEIRQVMKQMKTMKEHNEDTKLECRIREWEHYDIEYWKSYGVTLEWLKYAEVYPVSHKIIVKNNQRMIFKADKYAYAFVERKEGNITLKIYQPYNTKGYKWSNKHDRSVISLWTKIPQYGHRVVICSSLKDALCLSNNIRIPALAVQGEGYEISETAINELKRRYSYIYILFDNDEAGLEDGKKLAEKTGFINLTLPNFSGGKDISDMYKVLGETQFKEKMYELFDEVDDLPF